MRRARGPARHRVPTPPPALADRWQARGVHRHRTAVAVGARREQGGIGGPAGSAGDAGVARTTPPSASRAREVLASEPSEGTRELALSEDERTDVSESAGEVRGLCRAVQSQVVMLTPR